MCCKGKKCFGEQSLMVVRIHTITLSTLTEIVRAHEQGVPQEFMNREGHWTKLLGVSFVGVDRVVCMPDWPLYLTPDHELLDGTKAGDRGKKQRDKQLVYALTFNEDAIMVGPFLTKVLRPEPM